MRRNVLLWVAALVIVAGCSSDRATGTLQGDLGYGGPSPGPGMKQTLLPGQVSVRNDKELVTAFDVGSGHSFHVALANGEYTIDGSSGSATCTPTTVTIRDGKTTVVRLQCPVP